MKAMRGYFSLIQYCPDLSRMEAVNVGVVLFCPEAKFIEARTSAGNDNACRMFRRENVDRARLNAAKHAIEARFRTYRESFQKLADLEKFVQTRGNEILLTAPRPYKVLSPEDDLQRIFKELVGGRSRTEPKQPKFPALDTVFRRLAEQRRAMLDQVIAVPMIGRPLRVPYVYQNGDTNLVKPQTFAGDEKRATDAAMRLAVEGDLLFKHPSADAKKSKLIIVSDFEGHTAPNLQNRVYGLLREYNVDPIPPESLPDFIKRVEQEAHTTAD